MTIAADFLRVESFEGEGLKRVVEYGEWFVGIKNHKPANDPQSFTFMEKHLETDEVFILLSGTCVLLIQTKEGKIELCNMEPHKVYCVPKGVWHNTIVSKDVKIALIENRNTSGENSEMFDLSSAQLATLKKELQAFF